MSKKQEKENTMNEQEMKDTQEKQANLPVEEITEDNTATLIQELEEQKEKYIRLLAEFENYKRRTSKERMELFRTAGQDVIKDLLPALDDMDRAKAVVDEAKDLDAVKQGLALISDKIRNILSSKGLKEIECTEKEFDVDSMESVTEVAAPSEELKGKVVDVVQKGYTLNDKIIRYAKVIVGK